MALRFYSYQGIFRLLVYGCFALAAHGYLHAELIWTRQQHSETLPPGAEEAEISFAFKNTGRVPVKITEIHTSCGCTQAKADQTGYAPGAEGRVTVTFQARGSLGPQSANLAVTTDETDREPYLLSLNLTFNDWVTLTPRLLRWAQGGPSAVQRVRIEPAPGVDLALVQASSSHPAFSVRIVPAGPAQPASLEITPRITTEAASGVITLTLRPAGREEITRKLYVQIR
jgi:hypothetical protein